MKYEISPSFEERLKNKFPDLDTTKLVTLFKEELSQIVPVGNVPEDHIPSIGMNTDMNLNLIANVLRKYNQ